MELNLKQLEAFVWVADLGSFGRAAERLGTTQPNISARIAKLEGLLSVSLMTRDAGAVRLTPQGQVMLDHARGVLAAVDGLVTASGQAGLYDGTLRLGVTEMVAQTWLRPYLRALKAMFPKLNVELTVDLSVNLERALAGRTLDLALQNAPFARAMSGEVELGTYPLVWVAAPGLMPVGGLSAEALAAQPILTHARDTVLYQQVAAHFAAQPGVTAQLVPSSNLTVCLQMTLDGMGVAILPGAMVAGAVAVGDLVRLSYGWSPAPLHFFARYDAERAGSHVRRAATLAKDHA